MSMPNEPGGAPAKTPSPALVLGLLLVVYTFNFLDRQILSILAQPVKADLGLSDTQMGALGGLAFAALYSTMAIPFGVIADRTSRSGVITISLAVWSGFTALSGMAGSFIQMFLCRLGVGIGEAGGVAPSYALIADAYPPERRGRATAVYALGIPLGTAAGSFFGAGIAQAVDWRTAFIVLGVAGLLFVVPFRLLVKEPVRAAASQARPAMAVFRELAAKPVFWLLSFAAAAGSMCGYGLTFWTPAYLQRSQGLGLVETGQFIGMLALVSGSLGVLAGGWLTDWLGRSDRAAHAWVPAGAYIIGIPLFALAFLASSPVQMFLWLLVPTAMSYVWISPVLTAVQHLIDPAERTTALACSMLINNAIGIGFGALSVGWLSDQLTPGYGADALRWAMIWSLALYGVAAVLMLVAAPMLRKACRG